MEKLHVHLLMLLHEIDEICRNYDIEYYVAGGTVIGAVRHKGFIPWDDDVDLYMTRDNFYRFRAAFNEEQPKDRALECLDDNEEYPGTITRYIEETTTTLCRFHCLNTCAGGLIIDIFILDPIPDEPEKQRQFLSKLNIYTDFVMPYYSFSHRNDTEDYQLYKEYQKKAKKIGKKAVLKELESDLFQYSESECKSYVLRWATLPSIFSKEMMGKPVFLPFEDMRVPVPAQWWDYLYQLYGADWMYIPKPGETQPHISVVNMDLPYTAYTSEYEPLIDKKAALENYQLRKDTLIKRQGLSRPWDRQLLQANADYVVYIQEKIVRAAGADLPEMMKTNAFEQIVQLFDYYLSSQCRPEFLGKMRHVYWYQYNNPKFIPIKDDWLYDLLYSLVAIGQQKKAEAIFRARKLTEVPLTLELKMLEDLLGKIKAICSAYYSNRLSLARETIKQIPTEHLEIKALKHIGILLEVAYAEEECEFEKLGAKFSGELQKDHENGEILKAYGDILYKQGKLKAAKSVYNHAVTLTDNGMLLLDIKEKVGIEKSISVDLDEVKDTKEMDMSPFEEVQFKLLQEIDSICKNYEIQYFLEGKTALHAYHNHTFRGNYMVNQIMMTPKDALKFIHAVKELDAPNRHLDSLLNNENHVGYDLLYADQETLYFPVNQHKRYSGLGIFIRIKVLRKKSTNSFDNIFIRGLEYLHESYQQELPATSKFGTKIGAKIGKSIAVVIGKCGRRRLAKYLFNKITKTSIRSKRKECFLTKRNRKLKHKNRYYPTNWFETVDFAVLYNQKFPIPGESETYFFYEYGEVDNSQLVYKEQERSLFLFVDTHLSYQEFVKCVDLSFLNNKERKNYEQARKYGSLSRQMNKEVGRYWAIVCRVDEKMKQQKQYMPLKPQIIELYNTGQYKELMQLLDDYDKAVRYYLPYKLAFYFDEEILMIYCDCLCKMGKEKRAKKLQKYVLEEREH